MGSLHGREGGGSGLGRGQNQYCVSPYLDLILRHKAMWPFTSDFAGAGLICPIIIGAYSGAREQMPPYLQKDSSSQKRKNKPRIKATFAICAF